MISRREFLGLGAGTLGSFLFNPTKAFSWGAVAGSAPTHQYIVTQAMRILQQDSLFMSYAFPTSEQITAKDFVQINNDLSKTGTGPDVGGNSDYSWHYYNPYTESGNAPKYATLCFSEMIKNRIKNKDQSYPAAWGAHFLADMFVPYHTCGMFASEAHNRVNNGNFQLDRRICDRWQIMYERGKQPPDGWGLNDNHETNIRQFCSAYPINNSERADWFDPWYWNGSGFGDMKIVSGSHAAWEYMIWKLNSFEFLESATMKLLGESLYDPLWRNGKANFQNAYQMSQEAAVETFAKACALRTRKKALPYLSNSAKSVAMAIRAVITMYRASVSSIDLTYTQEPRGKGYRLLCYIKNNHPTDSLSNLDLKLSTNKTGWHNGIFKFKGEILPNQERIMSWDIESGNAFRGTIEASGVYNSPDLGYQKINVRANRITKKVNTDPVNIDPRALKTWEGVWTWQEKHTGGVNKGKTIQQRNLKIKVDGTNANAIFDQVSMPLQVTKGGNCLTLKIPKFGSLNICMNPDRNSYEGPFTRIGNSPMQGIAYGKRIK